MGITATRAIVLIGIALHPACTSTSGGIRNSLSGRAQPNILVLFADDAGYADFGFQEVADPELGPLTPHIDRIAAAGARFSDFYMSGAVCSPSRAGLLTGRYQQRFGHEKNIPPGYMLGGLPLSELTMADHLRKAGYVTGLIGKWHLGYPEAYHPNERGFDEFYGCLQGSRSYFELESPSAHRVILENREPTPEEGYVTDRFGEAAVRFIEAHRQRLFFLFVSFTAPHGPLQAKSEDLQLPGIASIEKGRRRKYAGLVKAMDDNVGQILGALDREGLTENTLVIFTNDNGGQTSTGAINAPLRGRKGQLTEGGIRVPAAMRWPGVIEAGRTIREPVISLDLLPTFLALAGGSTTGALEPDGLDLSPLLAGETWSDSSRALFWRVKGRSGPLAMREGSWKLYWPDRSQGPELYDLSRDIGEQVDLAAQHPERLCRMSSKLEDWESELSEPLWGN